MLQRAGEEDYQSLDNNNHIAIYPRHVEGKLGATLIKRTEKQSRQNNPEGVIAAH